MKIPISDLPHTADEAVDQLYADISLNDEVLLSSFSFEQTTVAYHYQDTKNVDSEGEQTIPYFNWKLFTQI